MRTINRDANGGLGVVANAGARLLKLEGGRNSRLHECGFRRVEGKGERLEAV